MKNNLRKQLKKQKKQAGVALLEMLVVIGILGILAAGVVTLSTTAFNSLDEGEALDNLSAVKVKVQKAYKQQGNYVGLTSDVAESFLAGNDLVNPWGARLNLAPTGAFGVSNNRGFTIALGNMSTESCINVTSALNTESFYYASVLVGSAAVATNITADLGDATMISGGLERDPGDGDGTFGLTVGNINELCTLGGEENNATLVVGAY